MGGVQHRFTVELRPRDVDLAPRRAILRGLGPLPLLLAVVLACHLVFRALRGDFGPLEALLSCALAAGLLCLLWIARLRRIQGHRLLGQLAGRPLHYEFDERGLSARSPLGSIHLPWKHLRRVSCDPDLTLLFFRPGGYTTLPTTAVPEDALDFLEQATREAGGRWIGRRAGR